MATLTGNQINSSYEGLIKTADNGQITATAKSVTDGVGNATNITIGTTSTNFVSGTVDFTGSTVVGVGGGLQSGTGIDSIQTNGTITSVPAAATGTETIAIGNGATASGDKNISIGTGIAGSGGSIVIGDGDATSSASNTLAIGVNMPTEFNFRGDSVSVGNGIYPSQFGTFLGHGANHTAGGSTRCVAVGHGATTSANQSISLGADSVSTANDSVAIGYGVTAGTIGTVSMKALELQTDSTPTAGGIIMSDAGGTDRRINITAGGTLQVDSSTMGPFQQSYGKVTATGIMESDIVYATFEIPANTFTASSEFEVCSMEDRTGLDATVYSSIWISDTAQTIGNAPIGTNNYSFIQIQSSASERQILKRNVYCTSATTETNWLANNNPSNDGSVNTTTTAMETNAIDWTVNQYIFLQVWLDATVGTYTNYGVRVSQLS